MNSKQWRVLRAEWLSEHPLCEECRRQGFIRSARCVHHLREVESGRSDAECMDLAFSKSNLQSLCFECHARIHKELRSHTRAAHHDRQQQRLEQWVQRQKGRRAAL